MPAPLPLDLRERIVRAVEKGSTIRQAALRFEVSPSAAVKLDTFCHWGFELKFQVTGGARWPGFMLLSVIDAVIVT